MRSKLLRLTQLKSVCKKKKGPSLCNEKFRNDHRTILYTNIVCLVKHDETIHANLRKRREARLQALRESRSKNDKDKQLAHLETEEQKQQNRKVTSRPL